MIYADITDFLGHLCGWQVCIQRTSSPSTNIGCHLCGKQLFQALGLPPVC
jgi:hypothetical protein